MTGIDNIKEAALALGACGKVESINSISDAIALLMTPQGREFALRTGFPSLDVWRDNAEGANAIPGVYLDTKNVFVSNHDSIAVGDSEVCATLKGADRLYHVVAMHGATVEIHATDFAVVTVSIIGGTLKCVRNDGTAKVTVEQSEMPSHNWLLIPKQE